jgi:hypothetical protein
MDTELKKQLPSPVACKTAIGLTLLTWSVSLAQSGRSLCMPCWYVLSVACLLASLSRVSVGLLAHWTPVAAHACWQASNTVRSTVIFPVSAS